MKFETEENIILVDKPYGKTSFDIVLIYFLISLILFKYTLSFKLFEVDKDLSHKIESSLEFILL